MKPAFAAVVRTNVKKVAAAPVPFYYAAHAGSKRQILYVASAPGKPGTFASLSKIANHLKKKGKGEEALPSGAGFCAGTVTRAGDTLLFDPIAKNGVSGAALMTALKAVNTADKLGLGAVGLVGPVDDNAQSAPPATTDADDEEDDEEEDNEENEEAGEGSEDAAAPAPSPEAPPAPPPPPPPPPPAPIPSPADLLKLRTMMKARCAGLQKGQVGRYVFFSAGHDGPPLLLLSKPDGQVEGPMRRAGVAIDAEGAYRCVTTGGVELWPASFDHKIVAAELGLRFRAAAAPILPEDGAPDQRGFEEWRKAAAAFREANEKVDEQISKLQVALRASGDAGLAAIADKGLNGVTGNFKVPLLALIRDIESAGAAGFSERAPRAAAAANAFLAHLQTAKTVAVCDSNPLTPVSIRATLGPALTTLARAAGATA